MVNSLLLFFAPYRGAFAAHQKAVQQLFGFLNWHVSLSDYGGVGCFGRGLCAYSLSLKRPGKCPN
jgi:hypothetical protein